MKSAAVGSSCNTAVPPRKCLLFDRRYGWVLDEWKEPYQEALSGGRGMFCVVPLAKALLNKASESVQPHFFTRGLHVSFVANTTLKVIERPELLSPKVFQATLCDHAQKTASSMKQTGLVLMAPKKNCVNPTDHIPN